MGATERCTEQTLIYIIDRSDDQAAHEVHDIRTSNTIPFRLQLQIAINETAYV